jgi:dolichol kinase
MLSVEYRLIKIVERNDSESKDFGIIHYAISLTIVCAIAALFPKLIIPCGIGVFVLSFGDGAATLFGQAFRKCNIKIAKTKTLVGAIACFLFAIIGACILSFFHPFSMSVMPLLAIGFTTALAEIIGGRFDNYTVPFATIAVTTLLRIGEI